MITFQNPNNCFRGEDTGIKENPWKLKTAPGKSEYEMYKDEKDGKEIVVRAVGKNSFAF